MPGPHPRELRERVVNAYLAGGCTLKQVAERFQVGQQSVVRWVGRFRRTGSVEPASMGGARRECLVDEAGEVVIKDILDCVPDTTLQELSEAYEESREVRVSPQRMSEIVRKLGYTRKRGSTAGWRRAGRRL